MTERINEVRLRAGHAKEIIRQRYSWQSVADGYERLFMDMVMD